MRNLLVLAFLVMLSACNSAAPTSPSVQPQWGDRHYSHRASLLIPFYSGPSDSSFPDYARLVKIQQDHPYLWMVVIVNIDFDGPDWVNDPNNYRASMQTTVHALAEAGVEVVGYVDTSYTLRPYDTPVEGTAFSSNVQANIQRWAENFPQITGIFVDQMCYQTRIHEDKSLDDPNYDCAVPFAASQAPIAPIQASEASPAYKDVVAYYRNIYRHVRHDKELRWVITNPGRETPALFFEENVGDNIVTFEGSETSLNPDAAQFTSQNPDPQTVSALVYASSLDKDKLQGLMGKVDQVFFTNDEMPNPWDTLPPYLEDLAQTLDPRE